MISKAIWYSIQNKFPSFQLVNDFKISKPPSFENSSVTSEKVSLFSSAKKTETRQISDLATSLKISLQGGNGKFADGNLISKKTKNPIAEERKEEAAIEKSKEGLMLMEAREKGTEANINDKKISNVENKETELEEKTSVLEKRSS